MEHISAEIKGHFLRLYAMAFTDNNFHSSELNMLYQFAEDRGISKDDLNRVLTSPITEVKIPNDFRERVDHLYDFACMAWADGKIVDDERNTLKKYCVLFEIEDEEIDGFVKLLIDSTDPTKREAKSTFINGLNI